MNRSIITFTICLALAIGCSRKDESESQQHPVPAEELMNHPLMKEMARRHQTRIPGLRLKYDYSGPYGSYGLADRGWAYLDNRLVAEGKALQIVGETPSKLEVEIKHFSESGKVIYIGRTLFVVGNVWKPGDDPVLPGAPLTSTTIEGRKERTIFNQWPVGQRF